MQKTYQVGDDIIINDTKVGALTAQDGTPWFNAVDVCKVLGYENVTATLKKHVDDVDLSKCETKMNGKLRTVNFVNKSGL